MNTRSVIRRKWYGCAALLAVLGLVVGGTACSPPPQVGGQPGVGMPAGGEMKTVAVVAFNSYQRLLGDVSFIGSLAGMPGMDQVVQAQVLQAVGDKGLAAVDKAKPWGVVLQTNGAAFVPLGAIPVTNADDLLGAIAARGLPLNDRGNGLRDVTLPNGMPLFIKSQGGWLLFGQSPDAFEHIPTTLQADLTALVTNYDLAVRINIADVPEMYRGIAMSAMQGGLEQSLKQQPNESEEQFALRRQAAQANIQQLKQFFEEADKLTVGFAIDAKQQKSYYDVDVQARPGTELAKQMAIAGEPTTAFGGFYRSDAAATMTFSQQIEPTAANDVAAQMRASANTMRQQLYAALEKDGNVPAGVRDAVKLAADDFMDAMISTAETGKLDGGAFLQLCPRR